MCMSQVISRSVSRSYIVYLHICFGHSIIISTFPSQSLSFLKMQIIFQVGRMMSGIQNYRVAVLSVFRQPYQGRTMKMPAIINNGHGIECNQEGVNIYLLTQKRSDLKPGILRWEAPVWWRYWKNPSRSSISRMASSTVFMTLVACSCSSSLVACCSFVFSSLNLSKRLRSSSFCSNNLKKWKSFSDRNSQGKDKPSN